MIVGTTPEQARTILGAMRRVGTLNGIVTLTAADRLTIDAAWRHVFGGSASLDVDALANVSPAALSAALPEPEARRYALAFLAVMALVDGGVDEHGGGQLDQSRDLRRERSRPSEWA